MSRVGTSSITITDVADGYSPVKGSDYFDGTGRYVSYIFRASTGPLSAPTTGSGSYNGTTESVPSSWSNNPVSVSGSITWVSKTTYTQALDTGVASSIWNDNGWSAPTKFYEKGDTGTAGTSTYTANVYYRGSTAPGKPLTSTGSYNFSTSTLTPPTGYDSVVALQAVTTELSNITSSSTATDQDLNNLLSAVVATYMAGDINNDNTIDVSDILLANKAALGIAVTPAEEAWIDTYIITPMLADMTTYGSYFTAEDWSVDVPTGTDPLYVSKATFSVAGSTGTSANVPWSIPVIMAQDGPSGAGFYRYGSDIGTWPSAAEADDNFLSAAGRAAIQDDVFTIYESNDPTVSSTRRYTGSAWVTAILLIDGDMIATGTIVSDRLATGAITADMVTTGTGDDRIEISNTSIKVYNGGTLRVKIGLL